MPGAEHHEEVLSALVAASRHPDEASRLAVGDAIRRDRGSALQYVGIGVPDRRRVVRQGFSFCALGDAAVLGVWDSLWRESPNGDVLFAALDYYRPIVRRQVPPILWPVVRGWIDRIDNWAHCDELGGLYSWVLAAQPDDVYPQLVTWNRSGDQWMRRISMVSLIHYSGKNAVFMPSEMVLPLVSNCLDDRRSHVQKAVGWVLRETGNAHPQHVRRYLEEHIDELSALAFSRAIERRPGSSGQSCGACARDAAAHRIVTFSQRNRNRDPPTISATTESSGPTASQERGTAWTSMPRAASITW